MKIVKNLELNKAMMDDLSVTVAKKLRPAQLFGLRLRQTANNPSIQSYLQQKRIENIEKEQGDWTNTMSSNTRYR